MNSKVSTPETRRGHDLAVGTLRKLRDNSSRVQAGERGGTACRAGAVRSSSSRVTELVREVITPTCTAEIRMLDYEGTHVT